MKEQAKEFPYIGLEHRKQPLLPRKHFVRRVIITTLLGLGALSVWVFVGMFGYHFLARLPWVDSFLNAAMK
jgi:NhaP-type Na+/H+ or K+/H+ antiporter